MFSALFFIDFSFDSEHVLISSLCARAHDQYILCFSFFTPQALRTLTAGIPLAKLPRRGSPRILQCFVEFAPNHAKANKQVPASLYVFRWDSSAKKDEDAKGLLCCWLTHSYDIVQMVVPVCQSLSDLAHFQSFLYSILAFFLLASVPLSECELLLGHQSPLFAKHESDPIVCQYSHFGFSLRTQV